MPGERYVMKHTDKGWKTMGQRDEEEIPNPRMTIVPVPSMARACEDGMQIHGYMSERKAVLCHMIDSYERQSQVHNSQVANVCNAYKNTIRALQMELQDLRNEKDELYEKFNRTAEAAQALLDCAIGDEEP